MICRAMSLVYVTAVACLLLGVNPPARATTINIEFSNFALGTTFPNASLPTTIVADGADVSLSKYNDSANANGTIIDMPFGSLNNALFLAANLRAEILLPAPASGGFFKFRDDGGTNLLEINGQILSFSDPRLAGPGSVIDNFGNLLLHSFANNPQMPAMRSVKIFGTVESLAFIGQELTIDGVDLMLVPEPSAWALLVFGGITTFALLGRKRFAGQIVGQAPRA